MSEENYRNLSQQLADFRADISASIAQIITWQKALTAGLVVAGVIATSIIGLIMFLHSEQTTRITRVEERIVSRLEAVFANPPTTTCQCDETKAEDE